VQADTWTVTAFLTWLESSALGETVRSGGVWSYAFINLVHIAGVSTLFGSILVLDLRMLGLFRRAPLAAISVPTVPLAATGFVIAAISGLCMLSTNATEYRNNPFLLIKFSAILAGLINIAVVHRLPAWQQRWTDSLDPRHRRQLAAAGGISLLAWGSAMTAGRMIGYW
jgi:hypothetical protein